MPIYMKMSLSPSSNVITGLLGNKQVHCTFRSGAAAPPPGSYDVHPPIEDLVYGRYALMVRQSASRGATIAYDPTNPKTEAHSLNFVPGSSPGGFEYGRPSGEESG